MKWSWRLARLDDEGAIALGQNHGGRGASAFFGAFSFSDSFERGQIGQHAGLIPEDFSLLRAAVSPFELHALGREVADIPHLRATTFENAARLHRGDLLHANDGLARLQ